MCVCVVHIGLNYNHLVSVLCIVLKPLLFILLYLVLFLVLHCFFAVAICYAPCLCQYEVDNGGDTGCCYYQCSSISGSVT